VVGANRAHGVSKLRLQEMGSRYLFMVLYVFLEHHLSRGDYRRPDVIEGSRQRLHPGVRGTNGSDRKELRSAVRDRFAR
jgi:hypothetical protein